VSLDAETGLEVKVGALRTLAGRERRVETFYHDWQTAKGLRIPRRQGTRTAGENELDFLTVETATSIRRSTTHASRYLPRPHPAPGPARNPGEHRRGTPKGHDAGLPGGSVVSAVTDSRSQRAART